jgi:hypothetical protein
VKQEKQRTHVHSQPYTTRIRTASGSNRSRDYSLTPLAVPLLLKPLLHPQWGTDTAQ